MSDTFLSKYKKLGSNANAITTHNCMNGKRNKNGGTFVVNPEHREAFLKECYDAFQKKVPLYLTERVPKGGVFKFFMDIDFDDKDNSDIPNQKDLIPFITNLLTGAIESEVQVEVVVSLRGQHKIHINCPNAVVDYEKAVCLYNYIYDKVSDNYPDLKSTKNPKAPWKKVLDSSVYKSGLRMLTSRKVADSDPNYYSVYTWNGDSFTPMRTTLDLLKKSSILVDPLSETCVLKKRIGKVSKKSGSKSEASLSGVGNETTTDRSILDMAYESFQETYQLRKPLQKIKIDKTHKSIAIPLNELWCNIAKREHKSNHPYILITSTHCKMKCHDSDCQGKEYKPVLIADLPQVQEYYEKAFPSDPSTKIIRKAENEVRENMMSHYNYPENKDMIIQTLKDSINTDLIKGNICQGCGRSDSFKTKTTADGWYGVCSCGERFPKYDTLIPIPAQFQGLREYLTLNVTINTTINNYNSDELFVGDYDNDGLTVFDDSNQNQIFCTSLRGSHNQIAQMIVDLYKDEFYYSVNRVWYHFREHTWSSDGAEFDMNNLISSNEFTKYYYMAKHYYDNLDIQDESTKRKSLHLTKLIQDLGNNGIKAKIMAEAGMEVYKTDRDFVKKLDSLDAMAFKNGVYDFTTLKFRPGVPADMLSKSTSYNYIEYDPQSPEVKYILKFMSEILPDEEVMHYVLKVFALGLTLNTTKQFFWILTGKGGNGKSKLMGLLKKCLGSYYATADPSFLTQRIPPASQANEALASLEHARLCVISEAEATETIQAGLMKTLTGEDSITTRRLYGSQFEFQPKFKLLFVCNSIPKISEDTLAVWRRVKVIDFPMHFVENPIGPNQLKINVNLDEELDKCCEAFLSILVHYYSVFRKEGLIEPAPVRIATIKYQTRNDHIAAFFEETLEKADAKDEYVQLSDLKRRYNSWYKENGLDPKILDMKKLVEFAEKPDQLGPKPKRTKIYRKDAMGNVVYRPDGSKEVINLDGWKMWKFV